MTQEFLSSKEFTSHLYLQIVKQGLVCIARRALVEDAHQGREQTGAGLLGPFRDELHSQYSEHQMHSCFEQMAVARGLRCIFFEEATSIDGRDLGQLMQPFDREQEGA